MWRVFWYSFLFHLNWCGFSANVIVIHCQSRHLICSLHIQSLAVQICIPVQNSPIPSNDLLGTLDAAKTIILWSKLLLLTFTTGLKIVVLYCLCASQILCLFKDTDILISQSSFLFPVFHITVSLLFFFLFLIYIYTPEYISYFILQVVS